MTDGAKILSEFIDGELGIKPKKSANAKKHPLLEFIDKEIEYSLGEDVGKLGKPGVSLSPVTRSKIYEMMALVVASLPATNTSVTMKDLEEFFGAGYDSYSHDETGEFFQHIIGGKEDKEKTDIALAFIEEIGGTIKDDDINAAIGEVGGWGKTNIIHKSIDGGYKKALRDAGVTDPSGRKENPADVVFSSVPGPELESAIKVAGSEGIKYKDNGVIYISNPKKSKVKWIQVSLKKGIKDARVGKVAELINDLYAGRKNTPVDQAKYGEKDTLDIASGESTSEQVLMPVASTAYLLSEGFFDNLLAKGRTAWDAAKSKYADVKDFVSDAFGAAKKWLSEKIDGIKNTIFSVGDAAASAVKSEDLMQTSNLLLKGFEQGGFEVDYMTGEVSSPALNEAERTISYKPDARATMIKNVEKLKEMMQPNGGIVGKRLKILNGRVKKMVNDNPGLIENEISADALEIDYGPMLESADMVLADLRAGGDVHREDPYTNYIIDILKVASNNAAYIVFTTIMEDIASRGSLGDIAAGVKMFAANLQAEAKFGETNLPLFIVYGGLKKDGGKGKLLGTREKYVEKMIGRIQDLATKHPIMIFKIGLSREADWNVLVKREIPKNANADDFIAVAGQFDGEQNWIHKDYIKHLPPGAIAGEETGRNIGRGVQYNSIYLWVVEDVVDGEPQYLKIQCNNRSGSSWSFKMDAM